MVLLLALAAMFTGCKSFSSIKNKDWGLIAVRTTPENITFERAKLVEEGFGDIFTLRFETDRAGGIGAPNRYTAPYTASGKQDLTIQTLAITLMAPLREPEKLKEKDYFAYLQNTSTWNLVNKNLELHTKKENDTEAVLVFTSGKKK